MPGGTFFSIFRNQPKRDLDVNEVKQTKWAITRKKGSTQYVIEYTALMLILSAGIRILSAGVGVAIDKGSWDTFAQDVQTIRWPRSLGIATFLGLAAGVYDWYSKERAYRIQISK